MMLDVRARPNPVGRAAAGVLLTVVGVGALSGQVAVSNCVSAACQRALFGLGLAGMSLVTALAQLAVLGGLALLWSATRRR